MQWPAVGAASSRPVRLRVLSAARVSVYPQPTVYFRGKRDGRSCREATRSSRLFSWRKHNTQRPPRPSLVAADASPVSRGRRERPRQLKIQVRNHACVGSAPYINPRRVPRTRVIEESEFQVSLNKKTEYKLVGRRTLF